MWQVLRVNWNTRLLAAGKRIQDREKESSDLQNRLTNELLSMRSERGENTCYDHEQFNEAKIVFVVAQAQLSFELAHYRHTK